MTRESMWALIGMHPTLQQSGAGLNCQSWQEGTCQIYQSPISKQDFGDIGGLKEPFAP